MWGTRNAILVGCLIDNMIMASFPCGRHGARLSDAVFFSVVRAWDRHPRWSLIDCGAGEGHGGSMCSTARRNTSVAAVWIVALSELFFSGLRYRS